jgi:hypothetical protein
MQFHLQRLQIAKLDATINETDSHLYNCEPCVRPWCTISCAISLPALGDRVRGFRDERDAKSVSESSVLALELGFPGAGGYQMSDEALGPHLADQWALPLTLAVWKRPREAAFTCTELTARARTNFEVIGQFLPVRFSTASSESGWRVTAPPATPAGVFLRVATSLVSIQAGRNNSDKGRSNPVARGRPGHWIGRRARATNVAPCGWNIACHPRKMSRRRLATLSPWPNVLPSLEGGAVAQSTSFFKARAGEAPHWPVQPPEQGQKSPG